MKISTRKLEIANLLTVIATGISLVMTIIYATQYAGTFDKRITLLEQHDIDSQQRLDEFKNATTEINNDQDKEQQEFQQTITAQLNNLDSKIDRIYSILITKQHTN